MMTDDAPPSWPSIFALLTTRAGENPERPFLYFEDATFTYGAVETLTRRLASGLAAAGVGKGDTVAIMMGNRPEFLLTWFALSALGAIEAPINTAHRGDTLEHMLRLSRAKAIIVEAPFVEVLKTAKDVIPETVITLDGGAIDGRRNLRFEDIAKHPPTATLPEVRASDPGAIMFTSGTTGPSKGAVLPQGYPLRQAAIICRACGYSETDRLYNALPLFHGNAQFLATAPVMLARASMTLARRFSARSFWPDVRRFGCTAFNYIGGILPILNSAEPTSEDAQSPLRFMMGAGAPRDLFLAFEKRFNVKLIEGYGMSEIGVPIMAELDARRPGACGRVAPEYEVRLIDEDDRNVAADEIGELLVRPRMDHAMMTHYLDMPEATVEAWRDLWFHTGDYLKRDAEGYFYFVDRKKDALRRRGENISSFEVERGVATHPAVLEAAVVGVPSELGEDEVMACVTLRQGAQLQPAELLAHCRARMAAFMVPRYIRILAALPKTPTERVQKNELRAQGVTSDTYDGEAS